MVLNMGPSPKIRIKDSIVLIAPPSTNADDTDGRSFFSVPGSVVIQPKIVLAFKALPFDFMLSNRDKKEGMQLKCL